MSTMLQEKKIEKIVEKVTFRVLKRMLKKIDETAFVAQKGGSFNFLFREPDLYSHKLIKL
ncbi:hypothetical protein KKB71_03070 [Patescibacteria group bacterium]|nr:hypothetical protein [Patescibacteria group bacterium]MBU2263107.1 hypothetical protein [Patescibacteria group bacterium]